jgi:hypothetical protein
MEFAIYGLFIYSVKTYAVGRYVEDSKNSAIRAETFAKNGKYITRDEIIYLTGLILPSGRRDVIILKGISLLPFKTTMLSIKIEKSPFSAPDN